MKTRKTELDRLASKLRTVLRRETANIVEIGNILLKARKLLAEEFPHSGWQLWLRKNFDLGYRSAVRYCAAAEYVATRKLKSDTVSHLSPTVLYALAAEDYSAEEEAAILAAARKRRVGQSGAEAIRSELRPKPSFERPPSSAADDEFKSSDIDAILDGPPPAVPPPEPAPSEPLPASATETDDLLGDFDRAVDILKRAAAKPAARFQQMRCSPDDLRAIADFLTYLANACMKAAA
jgi:hypothetical protein